MCAVLFDGFVVGEEALQDDGLEHLSSLEDQELYHLQKLNDIIRANPEKAFTVFDKLKEIEEHLKAQYPDAWTSNQKVKATGYPSSIKVKVKSLRKRGVQSRLIKAEMKQAEHNGKKGLKKHNKQRTKLGRGKRPKKRKKSRKKRKNLKKKKKTKKILRPNKTERRKGLLRGNQRRTKYLERSQKSGNCSTLWAELTNLGLGAAQTIRKQAIAIKINDKITDSKRRKGEDFNEHKDILEKALATNPCTGNAKRSANPTGRQVLLPDSTSSQVCSTLFPSVRRRLKHVRCP